MKPFPRDITWREGMDPRALATLLNEWTRDVAAWLRAEGGDTFLNPTRLVVDSWHAKPSECVLVVAAKKAMTVHLPPAADARGKVVGIVNVSSSTNTITVLPGKSTDTINGAASASIADGFGARFYFSTGEDWFSLSDIGDEPSPPTGANALLWEWNGTDTSQFEASAAHSSAAAGTLDPTLEVTASSAWPNVAQLLRLSNGSGTGVGAGAIYWLILASEFTAPSTYRYVVEITPAASTGHPGGPVFLADDSGADFYGHGIMTAGSFGWFGRVDAGTLVTESATPNWHTGTGDGRSFVTVDADKAASTAPRFTVLVDSYYDTAGLRHGFHRHTDYTSAAYPSGWQSVAPNRAGIGIQASGGNAFGTLDISAFRIWKHPRDL